MDRNQFDTLARLVWTKQSRRAALATVFGASLVSANGGAAKRGRGARRVAAQAADRCYPGKNCTPGKGKNTSRCDFAFSTEFRNLDVRGANLSKSSFAGTNLRGADFRGANLSSGCFASADLTGAKLGASVNLHRAVFCNTTMPDGTIDNSGCEGETPCCHRRVQNCPDSSFTCWVVGGDGLCRAAAGSVSTGTCWHFPLCCPCEHRDDQAFWNEQCQLAFPAACAGRCQAEFEGSNGCHEGFICP